MAKGKNAPSQIHVVKAKSGDGWVGKRAGAARPSTPAVRTQAEAEKLSKELARRTGGAEVITHDREGKFRSADTIEKRDPNPPRDREH